MDYNMNQPIKPQNGFITLSLTMGIISITCSIICCWTVYLPLAVGALAILFALLSKGNEPKMHPYAKTGLITGIIAMCLTICIVIFAFVLLFTSPDFMDTFLNTYESMYGESFDPSIFQNF